MSLDELLPHWHFRERHGRATAARAAALLTAAEQVTWAEVTVMRILMNVRSAGRLALPTDGRILDGIAELGFVVVDRTDTRLVLAGIGRPWTAGGASAPRLRDATDPGRLFTDFTDPGWAKIAFDFRVSEGRLSTETRVLATDERSRRGFGRYWLIIRPFSGLTRRRWLAAIDRRATRPGQPTGPEQPPDQKDPL